MKKTIPDSELLQIIKADIDAAKTFFEENIRPRVEENIKLYLADPEYYEQLMPELSKRSKFTSSDIADAIEAVMASLMRIFVGSDDVVSIVGRTAEDDAPAEIMQDLVNYQITRLNDGYAALYRWFKDALAQDYSVMKVRWDRQFTTDDYEDTVGVDTLTQMQESEDVEIKEIEPITVYNEMGIPSEVYKIKYTLKTVKKNQPVFEVLPYTEFLYDPDAKSQDTMSFAIHRKNVTADYLRKKADEGIYKNVEEAIESASLDEDIDDIIKRDTDVDYESTDKAKKKITIYEYYGQVDINGDGRLEDIICTIAGDTILLLQENTFEMIPFAVISPFLENNSVVGKGFASVLGQLQNMKTMLVKELVYNIAQSNDTRMFVNTDFVNIQDLLANKKYVRTTGQAPLSQITAPLPFENIHPATMSMLEYVDTIKENRSGVTRYNQGLDARSLNKTASGINMIMNAANQRIELIARIFAETGFKRFLRLLVEMNLKFIDRQQVVRLLNKDLNINPDDLQGKFDLIVNTGTSGSNKQEQLANLDKMLQITMQVLIPQGLATPKNVYEIVKKLYETMGIKNVDDYITEPQPQMQMGGMNGAGNIGQPNQAAGQGQSIGGTAQPPQGSAGGGQAGDLQAMAAMLAGAMGQPQG